MRAEALAALLLATVTAVRASCPDVSGEYRPETPGYAFADAVKALRIDGQVWLGSVVKLEGRPEDGLKVWVSSGGFNGPGVMPSRPTVVLQHGSDFTCSSDGELVFNRVSNARRKTDKAWYEGESKVRIRPAYGALGIEVTFSGHERIVLYSYESARVSLPDLTKGTTLRDALRWPPTSEIASVAPAKVPPPPEPPEVIKVRRMFDFKMEGSATLNTMRASGDAVLVILTAPTNDDVTRLDERLRAASIRYEMKPPKWSGRGYYELQILVWPEGTAVATRPSVRRVEQELERGRDPMVYIRKVDDVGDGYTATFSILGTDPVAGIIDRFKRNTDMFADIRLLNESERTPTSPRVAQIKLRLR